MAAPDGTCHLCGRFGKLSWEHVPPAAAFNSEPLRFLEYQESIDLITPKGRQNQRGAGAFTLCERCNNLTGKWYAADFARWCVQGAKVLAMTDDKPRLIYMHYVLPLRVLKQIFVMCFSINSPTWRKTVPELEEFVLDRERRWLNPRFRVFVYYNLEGLYRRVGNWVAAINLYSSGKPIQVTELSHPPFGYVVTTDGSKPEERLFEISHFRRYGYDDFKVAPIYPEVLPTHLGIPLDYRTREEIEEQALRSDQLMRDE